MTRVVHARMTTAVLACGVACVLAFAAVPARASGAEAGPQWTITSVSRPTNFCPAGSAACEASSGKDSYQVVVTNTGDAASDGSPVSVTEEPPVGLALDAAGASGVDQLTVEENKDTTGKTTQDASLSCVLLTCTWARAVVPGDSLVITFPVDVTGAAGESVNNVVRVAGGGAPDAAASTPTAITTEPARFGLSAGGTSTVFSSVQAGAHPNFTTSIAFNTINAAGQLAGGFKDTTDDLPPGFAGDVVDTPACPVAKFALQECQIGAQVGDITLTLDLEGKPIVGTAPVYNLTPNPGEVAKIGFQTAGIQFQGAVRVRPGDYGLETTFFDSLSESLAEVDNVALTIWGVPADPVHDPLRLNPHLEIIAGVRPAPVFGVSSDAVRAPFFTNPTSCGTEPLAAKFIVNSWEHPEQFVEASMPFGPFVGCDRLRIAPSLTAEATTDKASSATGLDLNMKIPQTYENPYGLATSHLKRAVVTLPEGMTVNPSAGAGLAACTPAQFEEEAVRFSLGHGCPNSSKLGTVRSTTPVLKEEASGSVFLATPYDNPFDSLLALYIVARIPNRGVLVKAAGEVRADPLTGRLVTTFDNLPPLPYDTFTFRFNQGQTSPLVTPPACGLYTVLAELTPWSDPLGTPLQPPIPPFPIVGGVDGTSCPSDGTPPFSPILIAGTNSNAAGSYSPFYLRIERHDGEQEITGFATRLPPGLSGNLSGIPFCSEADIAHARRQAGAEAESNPACPAGSEIGHTIAEAGVGEVLAQTLGRLYLGGPFEGAPFSVVSVTSAKVGPFDLGTVVVHLPLHIDPITAQVSIPQGPAGQIPHILKGIVIHLRDIRVYIDRQRFMLNPTSCNPMSISATVIGGGADPTNPVGYDPVAGSSRFQAADCASLAFKPSFKVSTSSKTSRQNGAGLHVLLSYPKAPFGTQANIRSVKVDLPRQLPSRLTTLQKACVDRVFDANPAACPTASRVGQAKAITPILPVPLEGPAYFVSHGGAKFPELVVVLQGYGITIDLHGETFISKAGITSSTFRAVPDQPVTSFQLALPQGPDSALAANGNLCKVTRTILVKKKVIVKSNGRKHKVTRKVRKAVAGSLAMPTVFTAQNGMTIHQNTPIGVTGCPKAKKFKRGRGSK